MGKIPFAGVALKNLFKSSHTAMHPHTRAVAAEGYRGKIKFDAEQCIGCGLCMKACGPECIEKKVEKVEGGQNITLSFDMRACTFCGLCSDFCPKNCVELTTDYSIILSQDEECITTGTFFKKAPVKKQLTPEQIEAAKKADAAKKAAAAKKLAEEQASAAKTEE